jgi:beta-RFAP synthase
MMIDGLATSIRLARAARPAFTSVPHARHELERVRRLVARLQAVTGRGEPLEVQLRDALPAHGGLGSGTQLALALGRAFSEFHGLALSTPALARLLDRGGRSGIGIAGFDAGGVLVDGGPRAGMDAPPVLARVDFPPSWRIVLVQDPSHRGLHGETEKAGIARLAGFAQPEAAHLCHLVLMQILPALKERDFAPFAAGLSELQRILGGYFAPAQGGLYTSPAIGRLMQWIAAHHQAGVGQSSWGPTSFAIVPSEEAARQAIASASAAGLIGGGLVARIVAGRNHGAQVCRDAAAERAGG